MKAEKVLLTAPLGVLAVTDPASSPGLVIPAGICQTQVTLLWERRRTVGISIRTGRVASQENHALVTGAWPAWIGIVVVAALLAYEHSLVKANDLSRLNAAFFTVNGYISMLFFLLWGVAAAVWRV